MNKTVTINISGIIFHIEEDAFDALSAYLKKIKGVFMSTEGGSEIMADIEARIAELLQSSISPAKQVVVMADVQQVMEVMGRPEDFGAENSAGEEQKSQASFTQQTEKIKRRLFRNPDDKAIGGVCSGLAAYFDIDTVWVRLAMFLLIFFGGVSLWVYIVLWIVMPEARTTADKFAMRGEPANINTIVKNFQEEAEDVKNRFNKYGKDWRDQSYGTAVRDNVLNVFRTIFSIIGRLFGLALIIIGGILLFAYLTSLLGISFVDSENNLSQWKSVIFASPADYTLGVFAFIIVVGIPVIMLVYAGVRLLFRIRYSNRWLNMSLGLLWVIGLITGAYVSYITFKQYANSASVKDSSTLHLPGDTIVIRMNAVAGPDMKVFDNSDDFETFLEKDHNGYFLASKDKEITVYGVAELNVALADGDSIELITTRTARGADKRTANENARKVSYHYDQADNVLSFDKCFRAEETGDFKAQNVRMKLLVPKGKVVYFDKSVKYFLDDVDNTTNTWDGDMVNRRWLMTEQGLKCLDCEGLSNTYTRHGRKDDKVEIDDDGIRVHGKDGSEVRIDNDGVKVHTEDEDVEITSDGVKKTRH